MPQVTQSQAHPQAMKSARPDPGKLPMYTVPDVRTILAKDPKDFTHEDRVFLELTLRRHVKRGTHKGKKLKKTQCGFVKGISEANKALTEEILTALGRKKPVWDETLIPMLETGQMVITK